jgi:hypothetical protein
MAKLDKADLPRSFGVFTPTGHVVMGFASDVEMQTARHNLIAAGIPEGSITAFLSREVVADIEKMRSDSSLADSLLNEAFMNESQMMDDHLRLAREGGGFLVVYAPQDADTSRVIEIAKQSQLKIAHKYNRLTLHHIVKPAPAA